MYEGIYFLWGTLVGFIISIITSILVISCQTITIPYDSMGDTFIHRENIYKITVEKYNYKELLNNIKGE